MKVSARKLVVVVLLCAFECATAVWLLVRARTHAHQCDVWTEKAARRDAYCMTVRLALRSIHEDLLVEPTEVRPSNAKLDALSEVVGEDINFALQESPDLRVRANEELKHGPDTDYDAVELCELSPYDYVRLASCDSLRKTAYYRCIAAIVADEDRAISSTVTP